MEKDANETGEEQGKMKQKCFVLSALTICISLIASTTLSYFNADDTARNVITMGGVEIALCEWADTAKTIPFENPADVMPGASVTKIVQVENTGGNAAWIRVSVTKDITGADDGTLDPELVELNLNTACWTLGEDGYLYYHASLEPGEVTEPVFTTVQFDPAMDNAYQNAAVTVAVAAQAVQTDNNGTCALDAQGWPQA